MAPEALKLPESLVSPVDAGRLGRELESLEDGLLQAKHREREAKVQLSAIMQAVVELNNLDLRSTDDRQRLGKFIKDLKQGAPVLHMSFAAEPQAAFTAKIISWLRREIHPQMLLDIGLQPSIAAGCIIRTSSKYFDCSIRQHLVANRPKLVELIGGR